MKLNKYFLILLIAVQGFLLSCKNTPAEEVSENTKVQDTISVMQPSEEETGRADIASEDSYANDNDNGGEECFEKSEYSLPYSRTINPKKATYKTLPCEVEGVEEFLCNNRGLRYISLPKYQNVDVVLVPMDCGDFNYRYFLLTVVNKAVITSQYVEGEWFEPGDDAYKEISKFSIDKNYKISIITNSLENGKSTLKEKLDFQLQPDGKLKKL